MWRFLSILIFAYSSVAFAVPHPQQICPTGSSHLDFEFYKYVGAGTYHTYGAHVTGETEVQFCQNLASYYHSSDPRNIHWNYLGVNGNDTCHMGTSNSAGGSITWSGSYGWAYVATDPCTCDNSGLTENYDGDTLLSCDSNCSWDQVFDGYECVDRCSGAEVATQLVGGGFSHCALYDQCYDGTVVDLNDGGFCVAPEIDLQQCIDANGSGYDYPADKSCPEFTKQCAGETVPVWQYCETYKTCANGARVSVDRSCPDPDDPEAPECPVGTIVNESGFCLDDIQPVVSPDPSHDETDPNERKNQQVKNETQSKEYFDETSQTWKRETVDTSTVKTTTRSPVDPVDQTAPGGAGEPSVIETTATQTTTTVETLDGEGGSVVSTDSTSTEHDLSAVERDPTPEELAEEEAEESENELAGGGDCSAAPTCEGDPIQCYLAQMAWNNMCAGFDELQQATADAEAELSEYIAANSTEADLGTIITAGIPGASSFTYSSCPEPVTFDIWLGSVTFSYQFICQFAEIIRLFLMMAAYIAAAKIIFSAIRRG